MVKKRGRDGVGTPYWLRNKAQKTREFNQVSNRTWLVLRWLREECFFFFKKKSLVDGGGLVSVESSVPKRDYVKMFLTLVIS